VASEELTVLFSGARDFMLPAYVIQMNESIELAFKEGSSDKVYHAELKAEGDGYVVNFAYGRRGNALVTGTKTAAPVLHDVAQAIYVKLIKSKTAKGYKPEGDPLDGITVVTDKEDVGIRPQLLNEITEEEAEKYLRNELWCMQEKNDGRRKMIESTGSNLKGANKKGFLTPIIPSMEAELKKISGAFIIDGEDMGDEIRLFDMISFPHMTYEDRYGMLEDLFDEPRFKHLKVVETAWQETAKRQMFNRLKASKAEGVVFKLKSAPYTAGRPNSYGDQLKCKFYESASCIVTSVSDVKRSIGVSVLDYDDSWSPVEVGNVTVYPNQDIPKVNDIVEVKYLYYYPNGSLYQPVLLGVRDDVDDKECLLSKLKTKQGTDD
jgi:bifunctional non-homologous end joining protein LigD